MKVNAIETGANCERERQRASQFEVCRERSVPAPRSDLLHRFTPTPHRVDLRLMERTVRLESNHRAVLDLALRFFERHQHGELHEPEFLWRLICRPDAKAQSTPLRYTFSNPGLRYISIGQRGFLAVDLEAREGIGYLVESALEDEAKLGHHPTLDALFSMTSASLGLVALSGGMVGKGDRGILVFGPPNSGKTTACYWASKLGMEFHADQSVFLDVKGNDLRAWGEPLPAVFRPETLDFLPELRSASFRSTYADLSFYFFDKSHLQARWTKAVNPICSVFLNRGAADEVKVRVISQEEARGMLRSCLLFEEDRQFDALISTALTALAAKPAYQVKYDSDPKTAAGVINELLS